MQARIDIPAKLIPVFSKPARFRGAYGGRGGAKTIAFANMAIVDIMKPAHKPWRFLCGRELQKSLKDSVFSVLESQISVLGVEYAFEVGKEFIRCKNGNEFLFYGLRSNVAEVKGLHGVRRTWLEEAQKVSRGSLTYMLPTVMRDFNDCELWATWNPDDEDDPIHDMFVVNPAPETVCAKINWNDNPWFPESLDKIRLHDQQHRSAQYDWIWEGNFNINTEGAVYAKWINQCEQAGRIRSDLYDPALPVHSAWDIGYSDYTTIWLFQTTNGEIRIIDYYENNREGIQHYAEQLLGYEFVTDGLIKERVKYKRGAPIDGLERRRSYKYGKHWVPHDAAHKLFAANGRSIVQQADDLGIRMFVMPAISQQNQIQMARVTLNQCWFDVDHCHEGIRALRKYEFELDEDKQRYKDVPYHNWASHAADAFELLAQCQKQPIMEKQKLAPQFWHDAASREIFFPKTAAKRERI